MNSRYRKGSSIKMGQTKLALKEQTDDPSTIPQQAKVYPIQKKSQCTRVRGPIKFYELKAPLNPDSTASGKIEQISDQEIVFSVNDPLRKGATLNMHFRIINLSKREKEERELGKPFHAIGRVRSCEWDEDSGRFRIVARFSDIFEEDQRFLKKFVESRSTTKPNGR